ncbi:hypothetical protein B8W66_07070 [Mycobacterium decipiens]|uniref:Uncharacterized protein n=1 Tax=Mycobacterium decipiens TaxID=1430326 RepID=A0A1X2LXE8_9MYCO|nr:hypothetical protein B8W66_07070 [Mycobacterium decipiens]
MAGIARCLQVSALLDREELGVNAAEPSHFCAARRACTVLLPCNALLQQIELLFESVGDAGRHLGLRGCREFVGTM